MSLFRNRNANGSRIKAPSKRRREAMSIYQPGEAPEELKIPLPDTQTAYRDRAIICLFASDMSRADMRTLTWRARIDSLARAFTLADERTVTSPTLEYLRAQTVEDIAFNLRAALADRAAIHTAIECRRTRRHALEERVGMARDAATSAAKTAAPAPSTGPVYRQRRADRAEAERRAGLTRALDDAQAELDRLDAELTELEKLDEQLRLDAMATSLITRYETRARYYLSRAHLPRAYRGFAPITLTLDEVLAHLGADLEGYGNAPAPAVPTSPAVPALAR